MACWKELPLEIRIMILEKVAEGYSFTSEPYARAGYARVCREWQPFFERQNFQRLVLDQERLSEFELVMNTCQRRDYLKHLFLRIRLDEYDCTVCQSQEDSKTTKKNNNTFTGAVWNLLIILSRWPHSDRSCSYNHCQQELTLELGAYSNSDSKHTFRDFHLEQNYPYQEKSDLHAYWDLYRLRADRLGIGSLHDPYHGWAHGHMDQVSLGSKLRLMGTLACRLNRPRFSTSSQQFPRVDVVKGLLIRRQFYRKIAVSTLGKLLYESFTCLQWLRHEGWYNVDPQQQLRFEKDYMGLISKALPTTLRQLCIFEDFNKTLHPERSTKRANPSLGKAFSKSTRSLDIISAAFIIDAEHFFADFWPTRPLHSNIVPWRNLRKLALTSRLLHPGIGRGKINKLLMAAGRAAAFMPKLEIMEIWNGGEGHACVFRYSTDAGGPQISWSSNWGIDVQLSVDVVSCWANNGRSCGNLTTAVNRLRLKRKQVKTYARAIRYLKMRRNVLHVISDYQVFWEEHNYSK
ncbi:hypothetical protein GGR51DRAFT_550752 [Nemania sp. FL0031]|nr:hypothetical protein GGR51DRAFT_550752 [Nemania sp. FL0031]